MPFKRKYPVRRRRRPIFRKRIYKRRYPRRLNSRKPYLYKQKQSLQNLGWPTGATPGTAPGISFTFEVLNLPNISAFQALYDEYKLCAIKFMYMPTSNSSSPSEPTYLMHNVIDYDDAVNLTSIAQAEQYQTHRVYPGTRTWTRYFKPRYAGAATTTTGGTALASMSRRGWLDMTNAGISVAHYGIKIFCDYPEPLLQQQNAQTYATFYVMFRSVR